MNKCKYIKKLISKYFDKCIGQNEKEIMFNHLISCQLCKEEFNMMNKIFSYFLKYKNIEISEEFCEKFSKKLNEEKNKFEKINLLISFLKFQRIFIPIFIFIFSFIIASIYNCNFKNSYLKLYNYELYPQEDLDLIDIELLDFFSL